MNQQASTLANVLAGLVRQRGAGLLDDRRRLLGLLRDKVPNESRAIRILLTAFDQGVPARLSRGPVSDLDIGREVELVSAETGISPDLAREAVENWAAALAHGEDRPGPTAMPTVAALPPAPDRSDSLAPPPMVQPLPAQRPAVQPLPVQPVPVQPLPVQPVPVQVSRDDAVPAAARSPRAQPVMVRQALKETARSPGPPPRDSVPGAAPAPAEQPRASGEAVADDSWIGQPAPLQPLPAPQPATRQTPVERVPPTAFAQQAPRGAEASRAAAPAKGGGLQKWAGIIIGVVAMASGGAKLLGLIPSSGGSTPAPAPSTPATPSGSPGPATTAEGIGILGPGQAWPTLRFERIKGDPATLAFAFGISYRGQSYTYYSAFALDKGKATGASKLVLLHNGQEINSGAYTVELHTSSNTQYYIESAGKVPNSFGAPDLCVFLNVAPRLDRLEPIASGSVGIYGIDPRGGCDTKVSYGYANLAP